MKNKKKKKKRWQDLLVETKMNLKPFLGSDELMQPKRKLVPGHGFALKKSSFNFSKKQRKNGVRINTESRLVNDISGQSDIIDNGAKNLNDGAPIFIQESLVFMLRKSHIRWMMHGLKGTKTNITTSAAQINKWRSIEIDILSTMDDYPIDTFLVGIGVFAGLRGSLSTLLLCCSRVFIQE
ncbi:hypothetical protein ACP275_04G183800 [Erythranthe tilingii]